MILVLTDHHDKHADCVCRKFELSGLQYYRLNLDVVSLQASKITFAENTWAISQHEKRVFSSDISSVWVRRAFVEVMLDEETDDIGFKIWRGEWNKTLLGLYNSLKKVKWLNPLAKSYQAENKYLQLDTAREVGFLIPHYIASNKKSDIISFYEKHNPVVLKPQNQEFYKDLNDNLFKGMYVNKVSGEDLNDFSSKGENPVFVQAYIEKQYEVRYTVVEETHHVCRIESQKSQRAKVDWRRYDIPNTPHHPMEPPSEIRDQVNRLMKLLGIKFGALDFIVTPRNDWYFLEINTMGQWLWIEDLTGLNISGSIVDFFQTNQEA